MKFVYELSHFYEDSNGDDIVTYIAVYSTLEKAKKAIDRLKKEPKFASHEDDFCIDKYEIDKCDWQEGFVPF